MLREEHRLRVFYSRALGTVMDRARDEARGVCRKVHIKELHEFNSLPDIKMTE